MANYADVATMRERREAAGFRTQMDLAKAVGVAKNTIGRIERGELAPSDKLAVAIAQKLRCRAGDLFSREARDATAASNDERELLAAFRGLGEHQAAFALAFIVAFADCRDPEAAWAAAKVFARVRAGRRPSRMPVETGAGAGRRRSGGHR
jgi:putative transcriptional regulator